MRILKKSLDVLILTRKLNDFQRLFILKKLEPTTITSILEDIVIHQSQVRLLT